MAKLNPKLIILACRNKEKGNKAVERIKAVVKNVNVEFVQLNLNDLNSVKKCAEKIRKKDRIDILLNNAGVYGSPKRSVTA